MSIPEYSPVQFFAPRLDNIPPYLRFFDQWLGATKRKVPIAVSKFGFSPVNRIGKNAAGETIKAATTHFPPSGYINRPDTWSTFDAMFAVAPFREGSPTARKIDSQGDYIALPAFVLTEGANVRVFDIDGIKSLDVINQAIATINAKAAKNGSRERRPFMTQEQYDAKLARYQEFMRLITTALDGKTFCETSMSGKGRHYFVIDKSDHANYDTEFGEVFASNQMIYMTGHLVDGSPIELLDDPAVVNGLMGALNERRMLRKRDGSGRIDSKEIMTQVDFSFERWQDCTFEKIADYVQRSGQFMQEIYAGHSPSGDWSEDTLTLIGHVEKVCPYPEMIRDFVMMSPRLMRSGQNKSGEDRYDKTARLFPGLLRKARNSNFGYFQSHPPATVDFKNQVAGLDWSNPISSPEDVKKENKQLAEQYEKIEKETPKEKEDAFDTTPRFNLKWPPGIVGMLAKQQCEMSHYPHQTLSIIWALSLCAGLAQRSFYHGKLGVNLYTIVLEITGSGKEGLSQATADFVSQAMEVGNGKYFSLSTIIGPANIASGPAAYKLFDPYPRRFCLINEMSFMFDGMSDKSDRHSADKKRAILDIKTKAALGNTMGSYVHSDKTQEIKPVISPSLTICGEGQPDRFYSAIDAAVAEDGLLSRFLVVDCTRNYRGKRNKTPRLKFSDAMVDAMTPFLEVICKMNHDAAIMPDGRQVKLSSEAMEIVAKYEANVVDSISPQQDKIKYNLFNRSLATGLQVASVLAAIDNPDNPTITREHALWAFDFMFRERTFLHNKFLNNEVGGDMPQRISYVMELLRRYPTTTARSLGADRNALIENGLIPYHHVSKGIDRSPLFKETSTKTGARMLDEVLEYLGKAGVLETFRNNWEEFNIKPKKGQWFRILDLGV